MNSCEDVSPQSALKNLDLMHNYLQKRLSSMSDASDLVPYINVLMPLNQLKIQLSSLLHQQFQFQKNIRDAINQYNINNNQSQQKTQKQEQHQSDICKKDKIRSLYIRLCSLNGIPSDVLHAKILSFLPSSEYKKIPMLSTHFRNIMKNYPFIYNHKKYTVQLLLKNRSFSMRTSTLMSVIHNNKSITIRPSNNSDNNDNNDNDKNKEIEFPFHDIHIWKIYCESVADWLWVGSEYRNQSAGSGDEQSDDGMTQLVNLSPNTSNNTNRKCNNNNNNDIALYLDQQQQSNNSHRNNNHMNESQDIYNYSSIQLLSKANNSIKKLEIENVKITLQSKIFANQHTFNQCLILNIRQSPTYDSILQNKHDTFPKLQYLEIWYPKQDKLLQNKLCEAQFLKTDPANLSSILDDRQLDQFYNHIARKKVLCDSINAILSNCKSTLLSFVYHDDNESEILSWGWCQTMLLHLKNCRQIKGTLKIPANIEWLSLRNSCFITDLTQCTKLIATEILGDAHYTDIKWPKKYIIPYTYLSPPKDKHTLSINHWKNMLIQHNNSSITISSSCDLEYKPTEMPSARFICLGKKISRATPSLKFSWDPELDDLNEIVDDKCDGLLRYKINQVRIKDINSKKYLSQLHDDPDCKYTMTHKNNGKIDNLCIPNKCLLLEIDEMNHGLFDKLMIYKFQREQVRINKIEIYQKWWNLGAATWIKDIGIIEKWNGRSKKKSSYWSVTE